MQNLPFSGKDSDKTEGDRAEPHKEQTQGCASWSKRSNSQKKDSTHTRRGNFSKMRSMVKRKLKGKIMRVTSLQNTWSLLKTTILEAQLECIPKRRKGTTRTRRMPAWLTGKIKEAIKEKKTSFQNWKACPNEENRKEHKLWQKKCKVTIREVKREFEEHLAKSIKGNNKNFFKYIRSRKSAREVVRPLDNGGVKGMIKEDMEVAEKLNEFFASVFTAEDTEHIPILEPGFLGTEAKELSQIEVTRVDVLNCFEKFKTSKSSGPDSMHPRVFKELKCELADLLAKIYNLSLQSGSVPEDWRVANVTWIFKKGSRGNLGNYRPVSLMSVPGKLMESMLKDKIVKRIEEQALLGKNQHGFCKGKSCLTNILEFFESVNK
ncbi:uncharacterized protein LOC128346183 [Hemicordylus capensis]|uniref:uncharacterized protein LOC128346183 n=1 Tax=Hemicordylus capensis TaxID=884348 RepID=UPI002304704A|nr:uncharacterized protein LOC128346183 [Hemicordylus capensis]